MKVNSNDAFIKTTYVKTMVPLPAFRSQTVATIVIWPYVLQNGTLPDPVQTQHVSKGAQQFSDWLKYK